jgi:hypothetical protein
MEAASFAGFAATARVVADEARRLGLRPPAFRSPPGLVGADRTVRRGPAGAVIAVRVQGRPSTSVVGDLVEGVVVANRLSGRAAARVRAALRAAAGSGRAA